MTDYRDRTKRWYGTGRWKKRREQQRARQPLCEFCLAEGRTSAMLVADHIVPHRGDPEKFWGGDLQSLCGPCHNSTKQRLEKSGRTVMKFGVDGWPV